MIHYFNEPSIKAGAIPLGVPLFTWCGEKLVFDPFSEKWNIAYTDDAFQVTCPSCKKIIEKVIDKFIEADKRSIL